MGSRPPRSSVRAAVRSCLADLEPGERVLVALSGGADSLALLAATVRVAAEQGLLCAAVVVDHGLQPDSSAVAARAAEQARILGCDDVAVVAVDVDRGPGNGGLEAAARQARYDALLRYAGLGSHSRPATPRVSSEGEFPSTGGDERVGGEARPGTGAGAGAWALAAGDGTSERRVPWPGDDMQQVGGAAPAAAILLGHTRDDQAETVLLGLARGSGTRSLAGMAPRSGVYRRPLLRLSRAEVAAATAEEAAADPRLAPWTDPANADPAFARVRARQAVLPMLADAFGPGTAEALARTAELARDDADALDAWAARVWAELVQHRGTAPQGTEIARMPIAALVEPTSTGLAEPSADPRADSGPGPLPRAVVSRVLRRFLIEAGCPAGSLTAEHLRAVLALVESPRPGAEVALPGRRWARRADAALIVRA